MIEPETEKSHDFSFNNTESTPNPTKTASGLKPEHLLEVKVTQLIADHPQIANDMPLNQFQVGPSWVLLEEVQVVQVGLLYLSLLPKEVPGLRGDPYELLVEFVDGIVIEAAPAFKAKAHPHHNKWGHLDVTRDFTGLDSHTIMKKLIMSSTWPLLAIMSTMHRPSRVVSLFKLLSI